MNMQTAKNGYGTARRNVSTPRAVEVSVLTRVTSVLAAAEPFRETAYADFVDALQTNAALWRLFAQDLSSPNNGLPMELRQRLFALAGFVHDETNRVLVDGVSAAALCDINRDILAGLSENTSSEVAL